MRERIGLDPDHIRRLDHIRVGSLLTVDKGDIGKKRANRLAPGVMAAEDNDSLSRGIRKFQFCRFILFRSPHFNGIGLHENQLPEFSEFRPLGSRPLLHVCGVLLNRFHFAPDLVEIFPVFLIGFP